MEIVEVDVVVAGGGLAGLLAVDGALDEGARVVFLDGSPGASFQVSSLNAALGEGENDTTELLVADMFAAGRGLNDQMVLETLVGRVGDELRRLADLGVRFAQSEGRFARRRTAGSSRPWAVYSEVMVGVDIMTVVRDVIAGFGERLRAVPHGTIVDLVSGPDGVRGAIASDAAGKLFAVIAPSVVLATGGAGALFARTTNQPGSRGVGMSLALAHGAELVDLEFVSYEPLAEISESRTARSLPTAVLNEGAVLRDAAGAALLDDGPAPGKDGIARIIAAHGEAYLDLTGVEAEDLELYPKLVAAGRRHSGRVPVAPAQHFMDGGIRIDVNGASTLPGLFAAGESAGGAHGAHRMAGCGGTETVGMGRLTGRAAARRALDDPSSTRSLAVGPHPGSSPVELSRADLDEVRTAVSIACGITRDEATIVQSIGVLSRVDEDARAAGATGSPAHRVVTLALCMAESALHRDESRGDRFRTDRPDSDDGRWLAHQVWLSEESGSRPGRRVTEIKR